MSSYFHHRAKTGDPAEQQTALSRSDTWPTPKWQLREHTVQLNPTQAGLGKYLEFALNEWQGQITPLHRASGRGGNLAFQQKHTSQRTLVKH